MPNIHSDSNAEKMATGQKVRQDAIDILENLGFTIQESAKVPGRNTIIATNNKGTTVAVLAHESLNDRASIAREHGEELKKQYPGISVVAAVRNNSDEKNQKIENDSKGKIDKVIKLDSLSTVLKEF